MESAPFLGPRNYVLYAGVRREDTARGPGGGRHTYRIAVAFVSVYVMIVIAMSVSIHNLLLGLIIRFRRLAEGGMWA